MTGCPQLWLRDSFALVGLIALVLLFSVLFCVAAEYWFPMRTDE